MRQIDFEGTTHEFPDDFTDADITKALGGGAAPNAPAAPESPKPRAGEIPGVANLVRDVEHRGKFGWATPLLTSVVPTTYPELAAMLGLTVLGGPVGTGLAVGGKAALGAVGKSLTPLGKWALEALGRTGSAAIPAAAAGAATGEGATRPGTAAAVAQGALEGAIPVARAVPGVSHWLQRQASKVNAEKLRAEIASLVPDWKPLLDKTKGSVQALWDTLVGPEGERALYAGYERAIDSVFDRATKARASVSSPALSAYYELKAQSKSASGRMQEAASAMRREAAQGESPGISPAMAKILVQELDKDLRLAYRRAKTDPRAWDLIELGEAAHREIADSLGALGKEYTAAMQHRLSGQGLIRFFEESRSLTPGVFGPRFDLPAAQRALGDRDIAGTLYHRDLDEIARIIHGGQPGRAEGGLIQVPLGLGNVRTYPGAGASLPLPVQARSPGYTPWRQGRAVESLAQPIAQGAAAEEPAP